MDESIVEAYLRKRTKEAGGKHRKVIYQGRSGSPDDWLFFPHGELIIVECKRPGEKPKPHQWAEINTLRRMGFTVYVVENKEQVDAIFTERMPTADG